MSQLSRKKADYIVGLCSRLPLNLEMVEEAILTNQLNADELSLAAALLADQFGLEYSLFQYENERAPECGELVSENFPDLFRLFLRHGMNPNQIFEIPGHGSINVLMELQYIDYGSIGAETARILFEAGADPNICMDSEQLTEMAGFELLNSFLYQDEKRITDARFRFWLVCMGFGGVIRSNRIPVTMLGGRRPEIFQQFENFEYVVENPGYDMILHIIEKESGEEAAYLE